MKLAKYFPILILFSSILSAQNKAPEEKFYFKSLTPAGKGVVATDNLKNRLYLVTSNDIDTLLTARGSGNYFSLSPDQNTIGVKIIDNDQKETPVLFDLNSKTLNPLHKPVDLAGQVSFSTGGLAAFTIGDSLHLSDGRRYDLGNYSNLAPISPSGKLVAYNDNNDQIHLLDLETNHSRQITDPAYSYYYPQWSPDGKFLLLIRFDGQLCSYNIEKQRLRNLTEGHAPQWQDNETIIFYKKEIQRMQLINTDLYSIKADGAELIQLTFTKDKLEIEPAVDFTNQNILYNTKNNNTIERLSTANTLNKQSTPFFQKLKDLTPRFFDNSDNSPSLQSDLDIPYIHQVYDVPNWFWGYYACAPTTSAMVLAYYKILPKWETVCSSPQRHVSDWGRYVCEQYEYNEWLYDDSSSPNGNKPGYGGYGYMWGTGGSPNSRMLKYHEKHGLTGDQSWNASGKWSDAVNDIAEGHPYSLCVWLTGGGHLVLGRGIVENKHSIVVNDPYGNRNTPGYPSYDGESAIYDWPGYNHGNVNLAYAGSGLPWVVRSRYDVPAPPDSIVDDFHLEQGFYLHTREPASMANYYDKNAGYNGHFWYMNSQSDQSIQFAEWSPAIENDGNYEISVYIPALENKTANAVYQIIKGSEMETFALDQSLYNDEWISLGIYSLEADKVNKLKLTDSTSNNTEFVAIDAVKFNYLGQWQMDFAADKISGPSPMTVSFSESIEYYSDNCKFFWEFGDGTYSTDRNPHHIYKKPGTYTVTLTMIIGSKEYTIQKENYVEVRPALAGDFSLTSPAIDSTIINLSPAFYWENPEADWQQFNIYIDTTSNFTNLTPVTTDTNYYQLPGNLTDNQEYFWKVEAISQQNDTLMSSIHYFRINNANELPSEFSLTYPPNNSVVRSDICNFQWEPSQDNDVGDQITYSLNLWQGDDSMMIYQGHKTLFSDSLTDNQIYFWNVIADDGNGGQTANFGDKHRFIINKFNDNPSQVELLSPENNATISTDSPVFQWSPSTDIDPEDSVSYELFIFLAGNENGARIELDTCFYNDQKFVYERQYGWSVKAMDQNGGFTESDTFYFDFSTTATEELATTPREFQLHQNYPNPFNPETTIKFDLPKKSLVTIKIYDIKGSLVETLVNEQLSAGFYSRIWQPENISSGVYFYRIETKSGDFHESQIQKCLFIK